jgi:membrane protease YdiL (CAAX protease family)
MFNLNKNQIKILVVFVQILLTYLVFWFLLSDIKTDGVWETVILSSLFFWFLPEFILKNQKPEKKELTQKQKNLFKVKIFFIWLVFAGMVFGLNEFTFLKLNYLARIDWYLNDWWLIFILNLFLLPIILISQEVFFRKFLFQQFSSFFSIKIVLFLQSLFFVIFEILFFGTFNWKFIVFNLVLAWILSLFYYKTRSIWYSFFVRWGLILILEIYILNQIQKLKI